MEKTQLQSLKASVTAEAKNDCVMAWKAIIPFFCSEVIPNDLFIYQATRLMFLEMPSSPDKNTFYYGHPPHKYTEPPIWNTPTSPCDTLVKYGIWRLEQSNLTSGSFIENAREYKRLSYFTCQDLISHHPELQSKKLPEMEVHIFGALLENLKNQTTPPLSDEDLINVIKKSREKDLVDRVIAAEQVLSQLHVESLDSTLQRASYIEHSINMYQLANNTKSFDLHSDGG